MPDRFLLVTYASKRQGAVYDDVDTRPAVVAIMERCGFAVSVLDGPASELVHQAREMSPELVVFDLASGGSRGLGVVRDLRDAIPACAIVVLAPFEGLRDSALEAGAYDLAGRDDLRDLARCLRRLGAELDARDSAAPGEPSEVFTTAASQRESEYESPAVISEVAAAASSEALSDREPEAGTAFAVQADEAMKDLPNSFLGDP